MRLIRPAVAFAFVVLVLDCGSALAQTPTVTSISPTSGAIGTLVQILGSGFGNTQGDSTVSINGANATVVGWNDGLAVAVVPSGATSGPFTVTVAGQSANSSQFTVTPLPQGWSDADVGSVGTAGTGSYTGGTFTVAGAGFVGSTADAMHFTYQSLTGDGTVIARVASVSSSSAQAGLMIRETLNANAKSAFVPLYSGEVYWYYRSTTGGSTSAVGAVVASAPYWIKLVRSGNSFSAYSSPDTVNWTQIGSTQTITMAQSVYIGLAVTSGGSTLATATFDSVSISSSSNPAPVITGLSATTASVGSQVVISGTGFGVAAGSMVTLNGLLAPIDFWNDTSITITVPSGGTSGYLVISVSPTMDDSNPAYLDVTSQPLPSEWLDEDIGAVGLAGSAGYTNGVFTVKGAGPGIYTGLANDALHFVYQPLSGDGTIIARVTGYGSGYSTYAAAGLMIRETLTAGAMNGFLFVTTPQYNEVEFSDRIATGSGTSLRGNVSPAPPPYWMKLTRSGNTFTSYASPDGLNWTQVVTAQTINMGTNAYVGLAVTSSSTTSLWSVTFDNVSVTSSSSPGPNIASISATTGSVGQAVEITGSGFGASENSSQVTLNSVPMTVNSWSDTAINVTVPSGATSGYLVVSVAPSMDDSNAVYFAVTSQPLPTPWLDQDVGAVGLAGSASYSNGVYSVTGAGPGIYGGPYLTNDGIHFVYQPLSGDGTIIARGTGYGTGYSTYAAAGVMIRETLTGGSKNAFVFLNAPQYKDAEFSYRATTAGATTVSGSVAAPPPYWIKLTRSGNTFTGYASPNGTTWTQIASQTINMATNVYIGLAVTSSYHLWTVTFDNVSVATGLTPLVQTLSPNAGVVGTPVTINGTSFGSTQGTSTVTFDGVPAPSITSWSNNQIVVTAPAGVRTGPVVVTVTPNASNADVIFTAWNPVITSLSPPAAAPGGQINLVGYGFGPTQGNSYVQLNGVNVATLPPWSDTSVTMMVPSGATSGPVTITVNGITSNAMQFTSLEPLSITTISPAIGPVGTTVTINGAGFGPTQSDSVLTFDGTPATVTSWTDTSIIAFVSVGSSTGPISIVVGGTSFIGPAFTISGTVQLTDSAGNQTVYKSAIAGGAWVPISSQGSGCSTCNIRGNRQFSYDSLGNLLSSTDPLSYTTSYTYDGSNNVASVTQPAVNGANPQTTYTYNSFGEVVTMTDPLGNVTSNTYDTHGNLLSVTTPPPNGNTASSVTHFAYNALGELTQITDPLTNITKITYTSAGLIATITDAQNNVTTYQYDSRGNRTAVIDAANHQTAFAYDSGNRLTQITYPDNSTASFGYDYRGRRTSVTDQNGKITTYGYDDEDRLTSVTDAAGNVTSYAYDTEDNLLGITDANTHTTSFAYDAFGRVTQTTFPSNQYEAYGYDADNNLTSKTDRKGQTIQYVYDALNRLTQKNYPDSTSAEYTYDLVGKILSVNDPTGTYGFAYDNMGRLIGTTTQYSFLPGSNITNSYSYDANSNRVGYTAPDGSTNTYSYDTLNRLSTLANSWAGSFGFSYDSLSRRTQMTRPNGVATNYTYDNLSRLLSVLHQLSGGTIDGAVYTLDAAGNRSAKTDYQAGATSNYTYDKIYELTQVMQGANTTESYSYDPVGNRLSSLSLSPYNYNTSNQLTSTPSASYSYDNNGNTTSTTNSTGTTSYAWDFENRLTQVTLPGQGGTVQFKYDPLGRRIYKSSSSGTTIYAYDGDNAIETTNQSGAILSRFAQGQNIDEPLAEFTSTGIDYYEADGLGSVTSLTNGVGTIAQAYTYDSFGNVTHSTGSLANPFRYTARDFDSETGVYYYRARYYDPSSGRFLNEDPMRFGVGVNFYVYVANGSTDLVDPTGLASCDKSECPPDFLQDLYLSLIESNSATAIPYLEANALAQATGNTVIVGVSASASGSLWPGGLLGGSSGVSVGIGVDPSGNIGLVTSGQLGGGYNGSTEGAPIGYSGGGSVTFTQQPNITGLNGSSPVLGFSGGMGGWGGSVSRTASGSTTITGGIAGGITTFGGVKGTKVFLLVCR